MIQGILTQQGFTQHCLRFSTVYNHTKQYKFPSLVRFLSRFEAEKSLGNKNKNRKNVILHFFTKIVQNPQKLGENFHESSQKSTFDDELQVVPCFKINQILLQNNNYKKNMSNFVYISTVFSIVLFPGCTKTLLSGESLYLQAKCLRA